MELSHCLYLSILSCFRPSPNRVYRTSEGVSIDDVYDCDDPTPIPVNTHTEREREREQVKACLLMIFMTVII